MRTVARALLVTAAVTAHTASAGVIASAARPTIPALLLLSLAFINPALLPPLLDIGELSLRWFDLIFALVAASLLAIAAVRPIRPTIEFRTLTRRFIPLGCYLFFSLGVVAALTPVHFSASVASFLRLLQTAIVGFLVHLIFRTEGELKLIYRGFIALAATVIFIGAGQLAFQMAQHGHIALTFRYESVVGVHIVGLMGGLLVVLALLRRDDPLHRKGWLAVAGVGVLGLFLAKAGSALVATMVTLAIHAALRRRLTALAILKAAVLTVALLGLALYAVARWRPSDVEALLLLTGGSYAQRLMLYYAAWQLFTDHFLLGVGWMASGTEAYLGSPALNAALVNAFPLLPKDYFPMFKQTSVHNMYLQMLVELGIVGFTLFMWAIVSLLQKCLKSLRSVPATSFLIVPARFYVLGLVFLLIWWNTTPLYGGQSESLLAFVFIGLFGSTVSTGRLARPSRGGTYVQ